MMNWDDFFLGLAEYMATASKDPSTKVGAVIVNPDRTVAGMGYNGFPRGIEDTSDRLDDRTLKYAMTIHAETNAILNANTNLEGCTAYITLPPCSNCAANLIQVGIERVICINPTEEQWGRWGESIDLACEMLRETGIDIKIVDREQPLTLEEYKWAVGGPACVVCERPLEHTPQLGEYTAHPVCSEAIQKFVSEGVVRRVQFERDKIADALDVQAGSFRRFDHSSYRTGMADAYEEAATAVRRGDL